MKNFYWSRLRALTWAVLFTAGGMVSCSDDDKKDDTPPPPPPVELKDQIEYDGGKLIDIESAIYEVEDTDLYTFLLSPTAGIETVAAMEEAGDYLRVQVRNPRGAVDTGTETFEIGYKDISVRKQTMTDIETVKLSADYLKELQRLNLRVEVVLKSGKKLLARYNNICTEAKPRALVNQFELNKAVKEIGSAVSWYSPATATTTWYFYSAAGVTAPTEDTPADLQITLADGVETASIDLSAAEPEKVKIVCGAFESAAGTTGTLALNRKSDGTMTLSIDAQAGDNRLRAAFLGAFTAGTDTRNFLKVTAGETPVEAQLSRVFYNKPSGMGNDFAFGIQNATTPEGLMEGRYAAILSANDINFGKTVDVASEPGKINLLVYDYETYEVWNASEGATGTIATAGTVEHPYFHISVAFTNGPAIEAEWYGDVTASATGFDGLVPVKPFEPHITVLPVEGNEPKSYKKIASMEVRLEKNYRLRGGDPQYGGATFDAYFLYFRPEGTENESVDDDYSGIPVLMIAAPYLGSTDLKLYEPQDDLHWNFMYFTESNLQYGSQGYSETYTNWGSTYGYCPSDVKVTVVKNEDKTWTVAFTMTDSGNGVDYKGDPMPWGSKNRLVIEWRDVATKYTGTKKNDLTEEDY